jgi:hypothetical protein
VTILYSFTIASLRAHLQVSRYSIVLRSISFLSVDLMFLLSRVESFHLSPCFTLCFQSADCCIVHVVSSDCLHLCAITHVRALCSLEKMALPKVDQNPLTLLSHEI